MIVVDPLHVGIWGTYITTPTVKPHYTDVSITTTVFNSADSEDEIKIENVITTPGGKEVAKKICNKFSCTRQQQRY